MGCPTMRIRLYEYNFRTALVIYMYDMSLKYNIQLADYNSIVY